jgi:hypothetical protein
MTATPHIGPILKLPVLYYLCCYCIALSTVPSALAYMYEYITFTSTSTARPIVFGSRSRRIDRYNAGSSGTGDGFRQPTSSSLHFPTQPSLGLPRPQKPALRCSQAFNLHAFCSQNSSSGYPMQCNVPSEQQSLLSNGTETAIAMPRSKIANLVLQPHP